LQQLRSGKIQYNVMPRANPPKLGETALWEYAVKSLAGHAQSSGQLRLKLQRKAEKQGDIDTVLARLKEYGYLDDRRFAESFATSRLENQQFGKDRVLRDLRERRVAPATAQRTVAKVYEQVDETALIEETVRRRYRSAVREGLFQEDKDIASAYRKLLRAGFSSGNIVTVLKRFARDPDLLDRFEPPEETEEE
jgi:regulatory protein